MVLRPEGNGGKPPSHCESGRHVAGWRPSGKVIAMAGAAAFLVKLLIAFETYGTNDVYRWELFLNLSRYLGVGLYRAAWDFNHPAFMIHAVRFLAWLAKITGLPFAFWFRVPAIIADAGSLWVVWKILGPRVKERSIAWALLLLAAGSPLLLTSGFHGNTDAVMIFFLLLSVYLAEEGTILPAGAAFGLAMSVKVVPLMTVPAIFLYLRDIRKQIGFLVAGGVVVLAGWSPFLFQDPAAIISQVFGYRSYYGHWGLSWLAVHLAGIEPQFAGVNENFHRLGAYIALGAVVLVSIWMNRSIWVERIGWAPFSKRSPRLFSQVGIIFFLFLSLSNGFGVQYLAWLAPWVVESGVLPTAIYYAASTVFLFLVYDYWSQGFPWYLADSNRVGDYQGKFDYSQLLCWLTVVFVLWAAWRQSRSGISLEQWLRARMPVRTLQIAALSAGILVAYPLGGWIVEKRPVPRVGADEDGLNKIRAQQFQEISFQLYQRARYQDSVTAAEDALKLNPNLADAYNNIAAGYEGMKMWDEAIRAASEALRLRPDFPLAKNNLAWAQQEKQKASGSRP